MMVTGEVTVELDIGGIFEGYEGVDLIYEDEKLPKEPEIRPGVIDDVDQPEEVILGSNGKPVGIITKLNPGRVIK